MHIAIARFAVVPAELDKDFRDWFAWSNDQLRGMVGLRGRRLLRASDGSYTALVEHDSAATFAAMHRAEAISMINQGLGRILNDCSRAMKYDVLVDFPAAETCCCDQHRARGCEGSAVEPSTSGGTDRPSLRTDHIVGER